MQMKHYLQEASGSCLRGARILVAGDSTARDTFYALMSFAGHPMLKTAYHNGTWPISGVQPDNPSASYGQDARGRCHWPCERQEHIEDGGGQFGFAFLMLSARFELVPSIPSKFHGASVVLVQCPALGTFMKQAYNYSLEREDRHRVTSNVNESAVAAVGIACAKYVATLRAMAAPGARIFLLGQAPIPTSIKAQQIPDVEAAVFRSVNDALGIECERTRIGAARLSNLNNSGVVPIDRFALVGHRTRDGVHPIMNAQSGVVQLLLNHICPHRQCARGSRTF